MAVDWQAVEKEYRAGIRTDRDLASEFGCSHTAIQKRAKKEGWTKDLTAKIRAKAEEKVAKDAVAKEVAKEDLATEREIVEANAEMQASIIRSHRKDIQRNRSLSMKMLAELEATTENRELFEQLGELLRAEDKNGVDRLNDLYRKVIDLPSRIDGAKKLADTLKVLIGLEREAFSLNAVPPDDGASGLSQFLAKSAEYVKRLEALQK